MSTATQPQPERRRQTRALIDKMLEERQQMLILYERVAGVPPYEKEAAGPNVLREFSQILVDYIAAGHFGLYERIADGKERRRGVVTLAEKLYPRISKTTDSAVGFNDAYERSGKAGLNAELSALLSTLGEELAVRIELEDQLIQEMLQP